MNTTKAFIIALMTLAHLDISKAKKPSMRLLLSDEEQKQKSNTNYQKEGAIKPGAQKRKMKRPRLVTIARDRNYEDDMSTFREAWNQTRLPFAATIKLWEFCETFERSGQIEDDDRKLQLQGNIRWNLGCDAEKINYFLFMKKLLDMLVNVHSDHTNRLKAYTSMKEWMEEQCIKQQETHAKDEMKKQQEQEMWEKLIRMMGALSTDQSRTLESMKADLTVKNDAMNGD